jgi:hypothetical protein
VSAQWNGQLRTRPPPLARFLVELGRAVRLLPVLAQRQWVDEGELMLLLAGRLEAAGLDQRKVPRDLLPGRALAGARLACGPADDAALPGLPPRPDCRTMAVPSRPLRADTRECGNPHCRALYRSNCPSRMPAAKACHSSGVKVSTGPSLSLLSRTPTMPGTFEATSTHAPPPLLKLDFLHDIARDRSTSIAHAP